MNKQYFTFWEFFAGGGMARLGLGDQWRAAFANDISPKKAQSYRENFQNAEEFVESDVFDLTINDLPQETADMIWASFPCQDLSLAGQGHGLNGHHSGSFWGFWKLVESLISLNRRPALIVLENVVGTITVRKGEDFQHLLQTLIGAGYRVGPVVVDGALFVPQSRPRLFIVAARDDIEIPNVIHQPYADKIWHPSVLQKAYLTMPATIKSRWVWWNMPYPAPRKMRLIDLIEDEPQNIKWHTAQETEKLLNMMSTNHREKVKRAQESGKKIVGTIYRRIRAENGKKVQRAEIRFDDISGCLRTGSGGSSKQFVMIIEHDLIRSRLLSSREAARLMGVCENYKLPESYSDAYHLMGDALVVPAVTWLSENLLIPLLTPNWYESEAYRYRSQDRQLRLLENPTSSSKKPEHESRLECTTHNLLQCA